MKNRFGLFRNYGWKKNLLSVAGTVLLCLALAKLSGMLSGHQVLSDFDPAIAVVPLLGFMLGIWGVIGVAIYNMAIYLPLVLPQGIESMQSLAPFLFALCIAQILYCALPPILWYAIPLKGERRTTYPRLDTTAKFIKYYLIMILNVAIFVAISALASGTLFSMHELLNWAAGFLQYLSVALILGIPLIIVVSVIYHRTITINERMVLAFLIVGVIASMIGAYLLYRTAYHLDPGLFRDFNVLLNTADKDWTDDMVAFADRYLSFWNWYYVMLALMLNSLLIIETLFMRSIEKKVTRPILHLADVLEEYAEHEEGALDPETLAKQCEPYRSGYGEVSGLTRTCVDMVQEIDRYTENLREVTAEKERIGTELDVASKIQRDMLPGIFPPFPDRHEIELFASMTPAKEVGGDFYDFYFIDRNRLVLTIADVSGKGVPASLFMVISKTLLKNHAQSGGTPKEILTYVNHQLCQNNDSFMFCTVWLGILDLATGKLTAANAGHEYPAVKRQDGSYEMLMGRHDPPLGVRDGLRYHEYEMTLQPGDTLFQYTDGVTEATNTDLELFGEERLIRVLNEAGEEAPDHLIERIHAAIRSFAGDAPQFDDITMLCIRYLERGTENTGSAERLIVPAQVESLDDVLSFLQKRLEAADCPEDILFNITLAAEEIFVNIARYAYEGREGKAAIDFTFKEKERTAELVFSDSGIPFDPTSRAEPDTTLKPSERQIGGLGIHIVKKTMDEVIYRYEGGRNILTIRKYI